MARRTRPRGLRRFAHLRRDENGLALTEFALVLPLLIVLLFGMVEFGEAFIIDRKLSDAAGTASDLVSQNAAVTDANLADIVRIAEEIIKPYQSQPLGFVITSVRADGDNETTVAWSYAQGTGATARAVGSTFTLPTAMTRANSSVIVAEATYQFSPSVGLFLTGAIELSANAYFRPRVTAFVDKRN